MPTYSFRCAECQKSIGDVLWDPDDFDEKYLVTGDVVRMEDRPCQCGSTRYEKMPNSGPNARMTTAWMP